MKKIKKMITIGCTVAMIATAVGCSSTETSSTTSETTSESTQSETTTDSTQQDSQTEENTQTEETTEAVDSSVVFGKVTAIDGSSITLALGEMPQGKDMGDGQAPDGEAPSGDQSSDTEKPSGEAPSGEVPSGEAPTTDANQSDSTATEGEKPSGEAPTGDGQTPDMSSLFEESGETLTITVDDESIIQLMSGSETTTGSLSDIAVDTILSIQYDDSNNITSITIQN